MSNPIYLIDETAAGDSGVSSAVAVGDQHGDEAAASKPQDSQSHDGEKSEAGKDGRDPHGTDQAKVGDHGHGSDKVEGHAAGHDHADHPEISAEDWTVQNSMDWYLNPEHLIGHVQDQTYFEVPSLFGSEAFKEPHHLEIPNLSPWSEEQPLVKVPENDFLGNVTFQPTKFIVLELVAAILVAVVFISLGNRIKSGKPVKGRFWNMLEAGCVYVRDEIARPSIGSHDADRFLPLLWTVFFFVLTMNLIGMVPGLGSATGSISITASLALVVFAVVVFTGMKKMGAVGFMKAQAPHIDIDGPLSPLKYVLVPMIWAIEVFGLFIKHVVLAVRLFANMFAGHLVLAVFVAFIGVAWASTALATVVVPGVIGASVGIYLLELLVAFIQAYVFTFLSALFIGAAIHPH